MMTAHCIGTLKLSEKQILALRRPVEDREIEWRPITDGGPPVIPYLSHNGYRDRLDAAFGLGGWGMLPVAMPREKEDIVYQPFALCVGGVPRVYAWGEQRYFETNREGKRSQMTYGDALEGVKSNAITRCGKELGVARELWNRTHVAELKARKASVAADGQTRASDTRRTNPQDEEPITKLQRQRLVSIFKHSGRTQFEVLAWLKACYGVDSTKVITRKDYQAICTAIERPGALPLGGSVVIDDKRTMGREPGEEG